MLYPTSLLTPVPGSPRAYCRPYQTTSLAHLGLHNLHGFLRRNQVTVTDEEAANTSEASTDRGVRE